ncbi:MAG: hypothetical protein ABSE90_11105 [Verrucomicrobiota bacterium]|jgi:hypothetical protein
MNTLTKSPQRKVGRPVKFDARTRRRLIEAIGAGVPICHACAACRVSKSGFHEYRATHLKFAAAIEAATAKAIQKHLRLIIKAAENGDTANSRWFLERVHPQYFGRTKIELTGADGLPLAAGVMLYLPQKETAAGSVVTAPQLTEGGRNGN